MVNKIKFAQLALRDQSALVALHGLISSGSPFDGVDDLAKTSYQIADAMLRARENTPNDINWSNLPGWAGAVATDEDGQSYCYDSTPTKGDFAWQKKLGGLSQKISRNYSGDWTQSLCIRGDHNG